MFTNLQMAKGNFLSRARGAWQVGRLLLRSASQIDRHQCIIRQGMTAGTELSFPVDVQKEELMGLGEREQVLKNSLSVLMDRFADQDGLEGRKQRHFQKFVFSARIGARDVVF